ncbi:MAG: hypothetical protein ACYCOU_02875 [Sulfobacillus sp.]
MSISQKIRQTPGKYQSKPVFNSREATAMRWIINTATVTVGLASVVVSGGAGGDEVVKIVTATVNSAAFIDALSEIVTSARSSDYLKDILAINFSRGPVGVDQAVLALLRQMVSEGLESDLQPLCQVLSELMNRVASVFGDWVSSFIPDDAGITGVVLQEILLNLKSNAYYLILDHYHDLPDAVQELFENPAKMQAFLEDLLKTSQDLFQGGNESWGVSGFAHRFLHQELSQVPVLGFFAGSYAGQSISKDLFAKMDKVFAPDIPAAVKVIDTVVPLVFAILAVNRYCGVGLSQLPPEIN